MYYINLQKTHHPPATKSCMLLHMEHKEYYFIVSSSAFFGISTLHNSTHCDSLCSTLMPYIHSFYCVDSGKAFTFVLRCTLIYWFSIANSSQTAICEESVASSTYQLIYWSKRPWSLASKLYHNFKKHRYLHGLFVLAMGRLSTNLCVGWVFAWSCVYYWFAQISKIAVDRSMKEAERSPLASC